jgi:predicted restriction endonuclease
VLARKGQGKFRSAILKAYECRCLITGESIPEVLEAAHIVPVKHDGADDENNGLCMRVDIHRLYDSGHLRIRQNGSLMLSDAVSGSTNYSTLPSNVTLPGFVNPANVAWRDNYL